MLNSGKNISDYWSVKKGGVKYGVPGISVEKKYKEVSGYACLPTGRLR